MCGSSGQILKFSHFGAYVEKNNYTVTDGAEVD